MELYIYFNAFSTFRFTSLSGKDPETQVEKKIGEFQAYYLIFIFLKYLDYSTLAFLLRCFWYGTSKVENIWISEACLSLMKWVLKKPYVYLYLDCGNKWEPHKVEREKLENSKKSPSIPSGLEWEITWKIHSVYSHSCIKRKEDEDLPTTSSTVSPASTDFVLPAWELNTVVILKAQTTRTH